MFDGESLPHRNGNGSAMGTQRSRDAAKPHTTANDRPTIEDLNGDNYFVEKAREIWLNKKKAPKVRHEVVKELWARLEKDDFSYPSLLVLETLQVLEGYLWPGYNEDSSDAHVLFLAVILNVKRREKLPSWTHFEDRPAEFAGLFRRVLAMSVDTSLSMKLRTHLLSFIIGAFESLDNGLVRKECAPLVSISVWHNLHSEKAREDKFEHHVMLKKAWRAAAKRYEAADELGKAKLRFERAWLYTLCLEFLNNTYASSSEAEAFQDRLVYCERFLELLIDLQSQLPTRRYVNSLLHDLNFLSAVKLSTMYDDAEDGLFRDMYGLLRHYSDFPIDDHSGLQLKAMEYHEAHCARLSRLQRVSFKHFNKKLKILTLSNFAVLGKREDLVGHLQGLDDAELTELCELLSFRVEYPTSSILLRDRRFWLEVLATHFEAKPSLQQSIKNLEIVPTEKTLFDGAFLRNDTYNGSRPLAIPKLNLQYLTMGDFLWRSFILHRAESFYAIRKDVEETIKRLQPRAQAGITKFSGQSRMALQIDRPAVVDVASANVGEFAPAKVKAEVILNVQRLTFGVRREWESLRPGDIVFLAAVHPFDEKSGFSNGHTASHTADKLGLRCLRTAEVEAVLDHNSKPLRDQRPDDEDSEYRRPKDRRLILRLDPVAFEHDKQQMQSGKPDVYNSINLIIRRRGRENNFKPILESIRKLTLSDVPAPAWLQEVFLGYGDPASATYQRLPNRLLDIDFRDTFLDWQHLVESFPGKSLEPSADASESIRPPYILDFMPSQAAPTEARSSKKRRRGDADVEVKPAPETIKVMTYQPLNTGPYPSDALKSNRVRFTPTQIEAIISGTQPGLSIIVGPPGTGKTDVATQIINNIYHDFPSQRTLLIAHSNQALNQLFQKIVALDIDERHLLRLGHGEEELEGDSDFSKYGRVESFLERASGYLSEVNRLAASIGAPGAHGNSCETADYFNSVYIKPMWKSYQEILQADDSTTTDITESFPLHQFFSNTPQPIFAQDSTREQAIEAATGCYRHISRIFTELEDIRPFEILRNQRDKTNYLLTKEARIIAMTSTHAAMRRQEIADLGFHYDNIIMEEAAQITEIENFIPLALQKPRDGQLPLQRIVLCGDHLQNSPIVQNLAFRQYANLEQSLFLRLIRLGVPAITLDQQGRARPSLADLYKWRYPTLESLPSVSTQPEFIAANAGFKYEYQFIDVPDYKAQGESEPSPHFIQNLGEAEYAVALYMYMRLLGYPARSISILAMYAGQKALIRDVLAHRCKGNRLFGLPRVVTTVDKYQGEQNDFVILSLTRTSRPGYIRDLRRLTVALSRSRLGLYILGRRAVFESCVELREAFEKLFARPTDLTLIQNESFPTQRPLVPLQAEATATQDSSPKKKRKSKKGGKEQESVEVTAVQAQPAADVQEVVVKDLEQLGQLVYQMTQAKIQEIKNGGGILSLQTIEEQTADGEGDAEEIKDEDVMSEPEIAAPL